MESETPMTFQQALDAILAQTENLQGSTNSDDYSMLIWHCTSIIRICANMTGSIAGGGEEEYSITLK